MSIDYGERERQFLATLEADTGRDIAAWMAAIAAAGLTERNDIIDWLRRQGFMFSKASWIERIHNNGGRPIYMGKGTPRPRAVPRRQPPRSLQPAPTPEAAAAAAPVVAPAATPAPSPPPAAHVPQPRPAAPAPEAPPAASLDALLARAKAYRPLANFVIAEIRKAVPGVAVTPRDGYLAFGTAEREFAVLAVSARELRLALAIRALPPGVPEGAPFEPARFPAPLKGAAPVSVMTVLTDARQITPALMAAVAAAANGA